MVAGEQYFTVDEVAARLRVKPCTVRTWVKAGRIEAIKPGKQFLITEAALGIFEATLVYSAN